jgi:hypothetical protein
VTTTGSIVGQRGYTYPIKTTLVVWECPTQGCGIVYGIPEEFADSLRANGGSYYCPNGHQLSWNETDADRERKKREAAERRAANYEQQADFERERAARARRSNIALRGHLTRIRNRIAAGVCPVPGCRRSGFAQVMRHLASKHPDWLAEHVHDLDGSE